jgi:hypothetical protein
MFLSYFVSFRYGLYVWSGEASCFFHSRRLTPVHSFRPSVDSYELLFISNYVFHLLFITCFEPIVSYFRGGTGGKEASVVEDCGERGGVVLISTLVFISFDKTCILFTTMLSSSESGCL